MTVEVIPANETLVDLYMARAIDLLRLEAGTRDRVIPLLETLEGDLVAAIARIDPTAPVRDLYQKARLEKLLQVVTDTIRATYRTVSTLLGQEIREVIDVESTWTAGAINSAINIDFLDAGLSRTLLQTLASDVLIQGAISSDWWGRQAQGLADRFADEMRKGMLLGEENAKLIQRVRGPGGIMQLSRESAERLVRASVQTAANVARETVYEDNTDIISALEWSATLDTRTTIFCAVRSGKAYTPIDHKPIGHDIPWVFGPGKSHWGCRSTSIPQLKSWRELGINADEVPETTRASMDGQVAASQSFETWLGKQSKARQDTVLGAGKAQLWRDGKITFRDLLDQNGRPLTTAELRARMARNQS